MVKKRVGPILGEIGRGCMKKDKPDMEMVGGGRKR